MLRHQPDAMIHRPLGIASHCFRAQAFSQPIYRDQPACIDEITLLRKFMAAHIELDPIAKSLLDTGDNDIVSRRELLLKIWLIKPGCPYRTGFIRDPRYRASSTSTRP